MTRALRDWDAMGTCPRCGAKRGKPCVTYNGNVTFRHVGRLYQPRRRMKIEEFGPRQAQLLALGSIPDDEGLVVALFRMRPEEARKLGPALQRWVELTVSTASIEGAEDEEAT